MGRRCTMAPYWTLSGSRRLLDRFRLGLGFRQNPLRLFNSDEFEDPQRSVLAFEDIADLNRSDSLPQSEESRVRRRGFHHGVTLVNVGRFIIARLDAGRTRQVRRKTEVLAKMVFQTMNPKLGHSSTPIIAKNNLEWKCFLAPPAPFQSSA